MSRCLIVLGAISHNRFHNHRNPNIKEKKKQYYYINNYVFVSIVIHFFSIEYLKFDIITLTN